jgi:DNA (cytosine-5)-methyltransferase 1
MPKKLRVGTDCSGIEAPIEALKQLKIPYRHVFSSEIDKYCIESIIANHDPEILFGHDEEYPEGDITKRDIDDVPDIDLYVCGFPCQPFSLAGKRKGSKDKRGNVFWGCYEVITEIQPKYFILENVKGILTSNKGKDWDVIEDALDDFRDVGYQVEWKVLNTKDYGIPQNRERIYIVGTKGKKFEWPKTKKMKPLEAFIDWNNTGKRTLTNRDRKNLKKYKDGQLLVDLNFASYNNYNQAMNYSPCITANSRLWCLPLKRDPTYRELLKLQGFRSIKNINSIPCLKKQIGNSMSVNIIREIIGKMT